MEPSTQSLKVRDIEPFVVRVGSGSPLVVCGGPQLGHQYLRALDALADEHEVIYWDARGSGRTALGDPSQLSFDGALQDLEALRSGLNIELWTVLGHSLGGHLAYLYASRYPANVQSLVLVDTGPPLSEELGSQLWSAMQSARTPEDDEDQQRIEGSEAFKNREPKSVERYILNIYAPFFRDRQTIATIDMGFTDITAANVLDYEERLMATLPDQDPLGSLAKVSCPTLVVHGEVDVIPVEFSRFLAGQISDARLAVIPGAAHFPFIEDREAFQGVVREFLGSPDR